LLTDQWPDAVQIPDKKYGNMPLHRALMHRALSAVLILLVKTFPEAVRLPDKKGNLPFHSALYNKAPLDVLNLIVAIFPDAVQIFDKDGKLPLHRTLLKQMPLAVIDLLVKSYLESVRMKDAKHGYLPIHVVLDHDFFDDGLYNTSDGL